MLPELTELQMYDNIGDVTAFSRSLAYYKPFLYVVLSAIVLILALEAEPLRKGPAVVPPHIAL